MPMSRGDVVIVAAPGDYGKPRPAVVVQSNALPESHGSVVVCQMTSELAEDDFRVTVEPGEETGLTVVSQIMVDKPVTIRRRRLGRRIGQLRAADITRLNAALAFVMGLAD
jgi:mRNA interferase MazF